MLRAEMFDHLRCVAAVIESANGACANGAILGEEPRLHVFRRKGGSVEAVGSSQVNADGASVDGSVTAVVQDALVRSADERVRVQEGERRWQ